MWDVEAGAQVGDVLTEHNCEVSSVTISRDGRRGWYLDGRTVARECGRWGEGITVQVGKGEEWEDMQGRFVRTEVSGAVSRIGQRCEIVAIDGKFVQKREG